MGLTLSCVHTAAVVEAGRAGCRTGPCCGGRRGRVRRRRIRSGPRCGPRAPSSRARSRPSTSRSFGGGSVQVSAGRSCCSKTRLVSCALTSDASLRTAKRSREEKIQCSVDKIPYLKLHCTFFLSLRPCFFIKEQCTTEKNAKR